MFVFSIHLLEHLGLWGFGNSVIYRIKLVMTQSVKVCYVVENKVLSYICTKDRIPLGESWEEGDRAKYLLSPLKLYFASNCSNFTNAICSFLTISDIIFH